MLWCNSILLYYTVVSFAMVEMAPNPLHYTLLYYTVLYFAMVEMALNPLQEGGCGILYHTILSCPILYCTTPHYTTLHYTILYYTILCCTILYYLLQWWRWHPIPFKKLDLTSTLAIWCCTVRKWHVLYYTLLYYTVLSFAVVEMASNPFQEGGSGIPPHYMIPYYTPLTYLIPFKKVGFGLPSHYMVL